MKHISIQYYKSPLGELILGAYKEQLCLCDWRYRKMRQSIDSRITKGLNADYKKESSVIIDQAIQQLEDYFNGERTTFDLPLLFVGTDFQKKVWKSLLAIPWGQTNSYLELSRALANEKAIRAVASANGANAISIIVPCHRIIGNDGKLVGYAGGLSAKQKLLQLEGAIPEQQLTLFE
ncbi:methylated-DNA--[protein]-cysteine S-methyltransferase [Carboxylicivirga sp. A043]|uniref:methylated-DNA--[protein]-cysteine S-methyltransferase n=1 Tax=Carboxylicivirga litoralis TaxID=2816963 RepID=UPI0021CB393E|nr:methylated-DNA--[protein]-cysteine S-methyltransferase [Carboxylicivirga sp. A043]MCU4156291.1 methylated-DNA--[protein]-cysteine S-methyltransferase [Carboxylicivirga sp. A043]